MSTVRRMTGPLAMVWVFWLWPFALLHSAEPDFAADVTGDPKPWTHTRFLETGDDFHFAVVADRNGGCRPGVFEKAVARLNQLRPAFVMSVGDFISGYSADADVLRKQWAEFDGILKKLEPPFFYVPGNHDYCHYLPRPPEAGKSEEALQDAADATAKVWRELRGPPYYKFVYRRVLFLCLNTMDGKSRRWNIGEKQLAWVKAALAEHPNVRWTFIFMHNPLWLPPNEHHEGDKACMEMPARFPMLMQALAGRNHTVFAGHWHEYIQCQRGGMKYFVLPTTGGCAGLTDDPQDGGFDNIMWVSMTSSGPRFLNLALDGMHEENVRTEAHYNFARNIVLKPAGGFDRRSGGVCFFAPTNLFDTPLQVALNWKVPASWSVEPAAASANLAAGESRRFSFAVRSTGGPSLPLPTLECRLDCGQQYRRSPVLSLPDEWADLFWPKVELPVHPVEMPPVIDGKLGDACWNRPPDVDGLLQSDGSAKSTVGTRVWLGYDRDNFYAAWRCAEVNLSDLRATAGRDGNVWEDDEVELFLNPVPGQTSYYQFAVNAAGALFDALVFDARYSSRARVTAGREDGAWTVEMAIPWADLHLSAPAVGQRLGFEFARSWPHGQPTERFSQYPPLGLPISNHRYQRFGALILAKK